jgi:hypothetical protein
MKKIALIIACAVICACGALGSFASFGFADSTPAVFTFSSLIAANPADSISIGSIATHSPSDAMQNLVAKPTFSTIVVNGEYIEFDSYSIDHYNYFKLRDLAFKLNGTEKQFEVNWDSAVNVILLTSGNGYTIVGGEMAAREKETKTPIPTESKILLDGAAISFSAYKIDGNNYFKLREIGEAFNFGVDWDGERDLIVIDTSKGYVYNGISSANSEPLATPAGTLRPEKSSTPSSSSRSAMVYAPSQPPAQTDESQSSSTSAIVPSFVPSDSDQLSSSQPSQPQLSPLPRSPMPPRPSSPSTQSAQSPPPKQLASPSPTPSSKITPTLNPSPRPVPSSSPSPSASSRPVQSPLPSASPRPLPSPSSSPSPKPTPSPSPIKPSPSILPSPENRPNYDGGFNQAEILFIGDWGRGATSGRVQDAASGVYTFPKGNGIIYTFTSDGIFRQYIFNNTIFSQYAQHTKGYWRVSGNSLHLSERIYQYSTDGGYVWSEWQRYSEPNQTIRFRLDTDASGTFFEDVDFNEEGVQGLRYYRLHFN